MFCSEILYAASLLSTMLQLNCTFEGTDTVQSMPAMYFDDSANGTGNLDIILPKELGMSQFLWNQTYENGSLIYRDNNTVEMNTTLQGYAFRLHVFSPWGIGASVDWENVTLHPAMIPLNNSMNSSDGMMASDGHVFYPYPYGGNDGTLGVYLDFVMNSTVDITDDITIRMPFEWYFLNSNPGHYAQPVNVWLTPYDFSHMNTAPPSNITSNLTSTEYDIYSVILDGDYQCIDVNSTYGYFVTNDGEVNCSRCATPMDKFSISEWADFRVIQIGAALGCESTLSPAQARFSAGEQIYFEIDVQHMSYSYDNASTLEIELSTLYGDHLEITDLKATGPLYGNSTWVTENVAFVDNTVFYTLNVNDYSLGDAPIVIAGNATIKDSLPLNDQSFDIQAIFTWTFGIGGSIAHEYCYETITSDLVSVAGQGSYIDLPAEWGIGATAPIQVNFEVPPGTISDVSVDVDLQYDTELADIELTSYTISADSAAVIIPDTHSIIPNRRKRAVSTTTQTINIGTIVNPASSGGNSVVTVNAQLQPSVNSTAGVAVNGNVQLNMAGQVNVVATANASSTVSPDLILTKRTKYGSTDRRSLIVELTVTHTANSTGSAYDVTITDNEDGFSLDTSKVTISPAYLTDTRTTGAGGIRAYLAELNISSTIVMTFELEAMGDEDFPQGEQTNTAKLTYTSAPSNTQWLDTQTEDSCTVRKDVESESVIYQHGITALAVIIGFVLGLVLVPLIIFIIVVILKKTRGGFGVSVQPSATDYRSMAKQKGNNTLLLDVGQKLKEGFTSAMCSAGESLVALLALRDRFTTNRELENLDIQSTVEVDKRMESERILAIAMLLESLLLGMVKNGDLTRQQYEAAIAMYKKSEKELSLKLEAEYKAAIDEFSQRQALLNRKKLGDLIDHQRADKLKQLEKIDEISDDEKAELIKNIDKQYQIEQDDLSYQLKLAQDEEAEKLRKEYSLKKRIQTKELQQQILKEVRAKNAMPEEMADWLIKEHARNVTLLDKIHDDELSRQRLVLEEKLAQRRALAELSDTQEKGQSELLNTMAAGQMEILKKAKKQKVLTAEEARDKSEEIMGDLVAYKQSMEQDMAKQETALHNKLSDVKKKQLAAKAREQEAELAEFEKRCKQQQTEGTLDPLSIATERLKLVADHEIAKASAEIEIDKNNSGELKDMRTQMTNTYKTRLVEREKKLLEELKSDGMRDEQVDAIISEHNSNVESLQARQEQAYQQQDEKLKMRLKKRRRDWEKRMEQEQEERTQLREQEATVVNQIIDSQLTMSVDERERILREHEANMVKLENSMTLNKLRQRQILEQKLADRRAKRLRELEKQQIVDTKKSEKRHADEDEDDQQAATVELLKSQAEERINLLTDEDEEVNFDEELEKVKLEMMQERAKALREQEDRLGSMVAQLQINKAKELTEIDEKQRAINELKANLIDDLNDRGVMSDFEAEQCLEQHRAQQEKLTRKLQTEREKQEKILKKKLAERLQSREKTLLDGYEDRLKEALDKSPNKIAAKLRKAAILHKRAQAVEEFKARMEKEISQSLEELKRESNIKKSKLTQELELRFIASLVEQGKLKRSELKDCLKLLFPAKSDKDLENLINTLHSKDDKVPDDEQELLNSSSASMLKERIARSVSLYQNGLGPIEEEGGRRRPKSSRRKQANPLDLDYAPETEGRQRLPPLKPLSAKKRRPRPNSEDYYD